MLRGIMDVAAIMLAAVISALLHVLILIQEEYFGD